MPYQIARNGTLSGRVVRLFSNPQSLISTKRNTPRHIYPRLDSRSAVFPQLSTFITYKNETPSNSPLCPGGTFDHLHSEGVRCSGLVHLSPNYGRVPAYASLRLSCREQSKDGPIRRLVNALIIRRSRTKSVHFPHPQVRLKLIYSFCS
jgi:hypothetical protein